ncbi:hypothetical protein LXA43DRAFT_22808 [Ganoderma leucocontextum]|nr:hypothetical protein LXA43DRAFT_22808 [Ganoderma leucocontextum]
MEERLRPGPPWLFSRVSVLMRIVFEWWDGGLSRKLLSLLLCSRLVGRRLSELSDSASIWAAVAMACIIQPNFRHGGCGREDSLSNAIGLRDWMRDVGFSPVVGPSWSLRTLEGSKPCKLNWRSSALHIRRPGSARTMARFGQSRNGVSQRSPPYTLSGKRAGPFRDFVRWYGGDMTVERDPKKASMLCCHGQMDRTRGPRTRAAMSSQPFFANGIKVASFCDSVAAASAKIIVRPFSQATCDEGEGRNLPTL